jgi:hypothetical protein
MEAENEKVEQDNKMTEQQRTALRALCGRYSVEFDETAFTPAFDLPKGWVAGVVANRIYVGCSPEGDIHS